MTDFVILVAVIAFILVLAEHLPAWLEKRYDEDDEDES